MSKSYSFPQAEDDLKHIEFSHAIATSISITESPPYLSPHPSSNNLAFPPTAVILIVHVFSVIKRKAKY